MFWHGKDAHRRPEALCLRLFPPGNDVKFRNIADYIDPYSVASKGSRNLHAVYDTLISTDKNSFTLTNYHSPIVSPGRGKILEFDNQIEDISKDGISFVLHNNVWGTNFPLWYEDNARFHFLIEHND